MNLPETIEMLRTNAEKIQALVQNISLEQSRWKPDEHSWSILEVINHLDDEERLDFRIRLDYILHRPGETAPEINPEGWVIQKQYNRRDPKESILNFLSAREDSLRWLRGLDSPDLEAAFEAPFGRIRAGDMLAAWAAHDILHMRQIIKLLFLHTKNQVQPFSTRYAGTW